MSKTNNNPYAEYGCKNRAEYLQMLSEEYGVHISIVRSIAGILGKSEDFDGLIAELEDYENEVGFEEISDEDFEEEGDE